MGGRRSRYWCGPGLVRETKTAVPPDGIRRVERSNFSYLKGPSKKEIKLPTRQTALRRRSDNDAVPAASHRRTAEVRLKRKGRWTRPVLRVPQKRKGRCLEPPNNEGTFRSGGANATRFARSSNGKRTGHAKLRMNRWAAFREGPRRARRRWTFAPMAG
jgi:hypothetical protein